MSYLPSNWLVLIIVSCITVTLTFVVLLYLDIRKNARAKLPLGYRPNNSKKKIRKIKDRTAKDIVKDRYFASKTILPKNIDFIVIGSGMSSLSCAASLSRVGRRVLVLEQHDRIGGCLHQFDSKFHFNVGVHYIGNCSRFLTTTMLAPITSKKVDLVIQGTQENGYVFDEYIFSDKQSFKARAFSRKEDLMKQFNSPKEHEAINKFYGLLQESKLFLMFVFLSKFFEGFISKLFFKIAQWKYVNLWNKSILEIYNNIFAEARLCGLTMMANYGGIGSKMSEGSMMMMCGLYEHYEKGGYVIKGGPSEVTRSVMPIIEANGGRCLANMTVKDIIFKNKKATGVIVETKNGKRIEIESKYGVISGAGFRTTYSKILNMEKLCKEGILSKEKKLQIENLLDTVKPSNQHFHIFIGFNATSKELELCSHNKWYMLFEDEENEKVYDYDEFVSNFHKEPLKAPIMGLLSFPSAKDPMYDSKHPGKSSAIILTEIPRYHFKKWENLKMNLRGDEYNALKKKIADRLMEKLLFKYFPKTKSKVELVEIGTALSAEYYLGTQFGESYGLSDSCERYFNYNFHQLLKPKQPIKQFYLTGQDIISAGFVSALRSGIWTAEHILGYHKFTVVFSGRTLVRDLNILDGYKGKNELNKCDVKDYEFEKYKSVM